MSKSFKQRPLKEANLDDFNWFDWGLYDELSTYGYRQWHDLVFDRLEVARYTRANTHDVVAEHVHQIKTAPLSGFGNSRQHGDLDNPVNSGTVKMLQVGQLRNLATQLADAPAHLTVDDILRQQDVAPEMRVAYFAVLMDGTDTQIRADFKDTLKAYRKYFGKVTNEDYGSAMAEWVKDRLVAYFDLTLVARLEGMHLPHALMHAVLYPDHDPTKWEEQTKRNVPPAVKRLFSRETANILFDLSR